MFHQTRPSAAIMTRVAPAEPMISHRRLGEGDSSPVLCVVDILLPLCLVTSFESPFTLPCLSCDGRRLTSFLACHTLEV